MSSLVRSEDGDRVVVSIDDTSDDDLSELRWLLHDLLLAGARTIVADVSAATMVGSGTLAVLLSAHRGCRAKGGGVVILEPGRQVMDLMHRTGLWHVFTVEHHGAGQVARSA